MAITRTQQARQMYKKGSMEPVKQAGVMNFMPSEMVTVPKIAKSSPDTPTAKLAYITPEEQDILIDLNLYGSLDGKPNRGPGGIPSLEGDFGSPTGSTYSGGSAGEDGGSRRGPPPGSPDYNRTATFTPSPALPPGVQKAIDEGRPTSIKTKEDERRAKKEVQEFLEETGQKKGFIETFNEKKRKKNQEYLQNLRNKKFEGIAAAYGLSSEQMQELLDAYNEDEDEFDLSDFRSIVDAGAPPSIISSDPNFLKAQELALSKGMAKGNKLSTGALFSTTDPTTRIELPGMLGKIQGEENFSNVLSGLNRLQTLDKILDTPGGVKQSDIDNYFNLTMGKGGTDPVTGDTVDALFTPRDDGPDQQMDPCKGPNPPAYCNIDPPSDPNDPSTPSTGVFAGIAPRFAGSIFDFDALRAGAMDGGIMNNKVMGGMADGNIDEAGRQMYFLGKLVKKATRAVKKVAKSPFGKAALGAALFKFGGGFGGGKGLGSFFGKGSFNPLKALITTTGQDGAASGLGLSKLGQIFNKFGMATGEGNLTLGGKIGLGLGIPFALDLLGVGKDDDDKMDLDEYYRTQGINIADIRNNPYNYLADRFRVADGGLMRIGYQEGGDAEPVAKKTMPLIDMDGQEKDYRETGGFVDMGRMERADDVPARLSKNEFVFTADAVRNAGEGDIDKGAEVMYNMMKNLESGGDVSEESQGLDGAREMFQTSQRLEEVL